MISSPYSIYREFTVKNDIKAEHIKKLSKILEHITYDDDYYDRLCVSQPPRTAKSSLITLSYPYWLILNNPDFNIVIVNNTQELANDFGIRLRQLFIDYADVLANRDVYLSQKKHSSSFFMFENDEGQLYKGSIKLTGTGGTITGRDVDILICDDLVKGFDDITPTLLDKKIKWFKSIILQRLEPQTKLIILGTRWATNDVIGYLKDNQPDDYKFVEIAALNKDETDCIWNNRYTVDFFKNRRDEIGERLFQSLYQQKPLDETGTFFNTELLRHTNDNYDIFATVRSYDLAYSDESKGDIRDYTADCIMHKTITGDYVISHVSMERYGDRLFDVIKANARQDTPNIPILLETGTVGGASEFLFKLYRSKLQGYNVRQSKPIGAKVDRATPFKNAILMGKVIVNLNDKARELLLQQLTSFPLGKHDDLVDALSYAYNYLEGREYTSNIRVAPKPKRITL